MPPDHDLKRDAEHLDYEVSMLFETLARLRTPGALPADPVVRSAVLESFLVHLRLLLEFFRTDTKYPDDLRAISYFEDSSELDTIRGLAPEKDSPEDKRAKEIHKALAHLVQDRGRLDTNWSEWDLLLVTGRLRTFFEKLPFERRKWFPRAARWFAQAP